MRDKKYIIGIVVVLVVVLGWLLLDRRSAIAPGVVPGTVDTSVVPGGMAAGTGEAPVSDTPVKKPSGSSAIPAPSAPVMTKSGAYIVSYLNSGFSPSTLEIKRGKSVHFVNNSNKAMSIMAVDQDSQTYRVLNQEQSVGRGGYFDFNFVTPGTWVYMDRNYRADRGTIIVD